MIWDPQTHLLSGRHFSVVVMVCESGRGSPRGGMEGREEEGGMTHLLNGLVTSPCVVSDVIASPG
jgi:hypothetical protein